MITVFAFESDFLARCLYLEHNKELNLVFVEVPYLCDSMNGPSVGRCTLVPRPEIKFWEWASLKKSHTRKFHVIDTNVKIRLAGRFSSKKMYYFATPYSNF